MRICINASAKQYTQLPVKRWLIHQLKIVNDFQETSHIPGRREHVKTYKVSIVIYISELFEYINVLEQPLQTY